MIYLGSIVNAGSDVKSNTTTANPFSIPSGTTSLRLQPSAATMMASCKHVDDTAAPFAPAATDMLQLGGALSVNDLPLHEDRQIALFAIAVRKTDAGAGTTKVFAIRAGV
jgi:hypothetical protein